MDVVENGRRRPHREPPPRLPSATVPPTSLQRLEALAQTGLRLARSAPSGRLALARLADLVDPLWVGEAWRREIEIEAARTAPTLRLKEVERVLRDAWRVKPTRELESLEGEPVAVTPIAQVHRAALDGRPVAVKVLRPGLEASVRQDLTLLGALAGPLADALPAVDPKAVLDEVRSRVLEELDLEHEGDQQRRFHRALRDHPFFFVPAPVTRLGRPTVLVSEWVDASSLAQAPDRDRAASLLVAFVVGALAFGTVPAAPGPDDALVLEDGRLALLDFGSTGSVSPARARTLAATIEAFAAHDSGTFAAGVRELGGCDEDDGALLMEIVTRVLGDLGAPGSSRLDTPALLDARDRLYGRQDDLARLLPAWRVHPPDMWPAAGIAQAFATVARLGVSADWLAIVLAAVREGWSAAGA